MKYGYARVSTDDQTALQLAALKRAGCKTVFEDEGLPVATTERSRPHLMPAHPPGRGYPAVWKLDPPGGHS